MTFNIFKQFFIQNTQEIPKIASSTSIPSVGALSKDKIIEDDVDIQLAKVDGTIKRNRDPKL